MDISTLFIGSGFALLIAFLAWGNQIRQPRKEIRELEEECINAYNLRKNEILPLMRNKDKNDKYSTRDKLKSIISLVGQKKIRNAAQLDSLRRLGHLHDDCDKLNKLFIIRYRFAIVLMVSFYILGIISFYTKDLSLVFYIFDFNVDRIFIVIIFVIISFIIINLIVVHVSEEKFIDEMDKISDLIEGDNNGRS